MLVTTTPIAAVSDRFHDLLAALLRGERVQVTDGGTVVAELVRPQPAGAVRPPADAAVAEIVREMIAAGHPPDADSPLWRYATRAA